MRKLLLRLADKPTPQIPESWLRYADRYFRKGRHHVRPGAIPGWNLRARMKNGLDEWRDIKEASGIQEAIALGY